MPIVSSVIHVEKTKISAFVNSLRHDTRVTLGDIVKNKVPIVLDSSSPQEDKKFWKDIEQQPIIEFVQYIFADFSDIHSTEEGAL